MQKAILSIIPRAQAQCMRAADLGTIRMKSFCGRNATVLFSTPAIAQMKSGALSISPCWRA
jgi:hypothetical protein